MWKSICLVCLCFCLVLGLSGLCFAGETSVGPNVGPQVVKPDPIEKEILAWKARAIVAEFQQKQSALQLAQTALENLIKELDAKGLAYKDGVIVEKPKPKPPEKKEEPKK